MDLGLQGKAALVAASSKGLGRAVAAELAAGGAKVMISSRDEASLSRVAGEMSGATGAEVAYHVADVSRDEDIPKLVEAAVERFGGIDILVNNAGGPPGGGFDSVSDDDWREAFEANLMSVVRLIRSTLPHMRGRGEHGGRILNIASSSIKQPIDNLILSNVMRAGIAGLSKSLASELGPEGILINVLGPGRILTERSASLDERVAESSGVPVEDVREQMTSRIPLGRYGTPEEFARVAAFLCSSANSYVTGQSLLVDGGLVKAL